MWEWWIFGKYYNDSVVTCNRFIEPTKNTTVTFGDKKGTCRIDNFDLVRDNIVFNEKPHENISIYNAPYKTPYGVKSLQIIFDEEEGYMRKYASIKYPAWFQADEKNERIFDRTRYFIILTLIWVGFLGVLFKVVGGVILPLV